MCIFNKIIWEIGDCRKGGDKVALQVSRGWDTHSFHNPSAQMSHLFSGFTPRWVPGALDSGRRHVFLNLDSPIWPSPFLNWWWQLYCWLARCSPRPGSSYCIKADSSDRTGTDQCFSTFAPGSAFIRSSSILLNYIFLCFIQELLGVCNVLIYKKHIFSYSASQTLEIS